MSCSKVQPFQKTLNNPFKDIAAGKPTYSDNFNFYKFYYEPSTIDYKTSKRSINHRNKTSIFDVARVDRKEKVVNPIDNKNSDAQTLKKILIPNSSVYIKDMIQNGTKNVSNEKYGKRTNQDIRNLYIFSKENNDINEKKSCKKISSYSLEKNPSKWGVDVFRYNLPSPRKIYRHVDNLSSCLVPKCNENSVVPRKKNNYYVTQLEKSLCPKEGIIIPYSSKRLISLNESKLDVNYVPKDFERSKTLNKPKYYHGNLNDDLTPISDNKWKSFHISKTCRNKKCSISFSCNRNPSPYRSGKRIGYACINNENPTFLF